MHKIEPWSLPTLRVVETKASDHFLSPDELLPKIVSEGSPTDMAHGDTHLMQLAASHAHTADRSPEAHMVYWPLTTKPESQIDYADKYNFLANFPLLAQLDSWVTEMSSASKSALFYMMLGYAEKTTPRSGEGRFIPGGTQSLEPFHGHLLRGGISTSSLGNPGKSIHLNDPSYHATLATQSNEGPHRAQQLLGARINDSLRGQPIMITNRIGTDSRELQFQNTVYGFANIFDAINDGYKLIKSQAINTLWPDIRRKVSEYRSPLLPVECLLQVHQIPTAFLIHPSQEMQKYLEPSMYMPWWIMFAVSTFSFLVPGGITVLRDQTNVRPCK